MLVVMDWHPAGIGVDDEGQLCDARLRRSQVKRDARRSPRSGVASAHPSSTKTLPLRATRARTLPALYTNSDDDLSGKCILYVGHNFMDSGLSLHQSVTR